MPPRLAFKVDVDTDRGTRLGALNLAADLQKLGAPACFFFSLGPDQTGRAIRRIFRPGFFRKVNRTGVLRLYGLRTLLNGTLLPAPHIGRRNAEVMRAIAQAGFEIGIHAYNHYRWQDFVQTMALDAVAAEFESARAEFRRVSGLEAEAAAAAGWQSNARSREVYERAGLLYASDTRGICPFFPRLGGKTFHTLEIPSTLPTFDELLGRPEYPEERIVPHYLSLLSSDRPNVLTIHAEIEGMGKRALFRRLVAAAGGSGVRFVGLGDLAIEFLANRAGIPVCDQIMAEIDGRSGKVACQGGTG